MYNYVMLRVLLVVGLFLPVLASATVQNLVVTANGQTGPITAAPGQNISITVAADIFNDGANISTWASSTAFVLGDLLACSSPAPDPIIPITALNTTTPGTATLSPLVAPATPGDYQIRVILWGSLGCTGNSFSVPLIDLTVVAATPAAVPTMGAPTLLALALAVMLLALRRVKLLSNRR